LSLYTIILQFSIPSRPGLPRNSAQRMKIEFLFAEEIRNIVAFEGTNRVERHERIDQMAKTIRPSRVSGNGNEVHESS